MTVKGKGYAADSSNAYGGKSATNQTIDYFDPETWTVADGFEQINLVKGSADVFTVKATITSMLIKGDAGFASGFTNGDVGAVSIQGDFSKASMDDFFDILDQLSVDPHLHLHHLHHPVEIHLAVHSHSSSSGSSSSSSSKVHPLVVLIL